MNFIRYIIYTIRMEKNISRFVVIINMIGEVLFISMFHDLCIILSI